MTSALAGIARQLAFAVDPEKAHRLAIAALRTGLVPGAAGIRDPRLAMSLWGLDFPGPLGMAAGFDKDGEVAGALLRIGFAFVEVGTVAPRPQPGNPRPRVFRLPADRAVINRYGFNTAGAGAVLRNLTARPGRGIVGVNIGANKDSADRVADYVAGVAVFAPHASYLAVNVSSPNTPGLRDLQHEEALNGLLAAVVADRDARAAGIARRVPLLLKIAPDLTDIELDAIAAAVRAHDVDGVIVANTTLSRAGLADPNAREAGGMSGRPLFRRSTALLARLHLRLGPDIPIVGVGGIDSADTAYEKIRAGASLVQVYTGLVYEGPGLVSAIARGLLERLARDGHAHLREAVGSGAAAWAREAIG